MFINTDYLAKAQNWNRKKQSKKKRLVITAKHADQLSKLKSSAFIEMTTQCHQPPRNCRAALPNGERHFSIKTAKSHHLGLSPKVGGRVGQIECATAQQRTSNERTQFNRKPILFLPFVFVQPATRMPGNQLGHTRNIIEHQKQQISFVCHKHSNDCKLFRQTSVLSFFAFLFICLSIFLM